jgi:hypothetical protein
VTHAIQEPSMNRNLLTVRQAAIAMVVMLLAGALVAPAVASGELSPDGVRAYRASVAAEDDCVAPDRPGSFTVVLTNTSRTIQLGSADITLAEVAGWQTGPADVEVDGRPFAPDGRTIELRDLGLAPLASVAVTFEATPSEGDNVIATRAKQSNNFSGPPGNDLQRFGPVPTVVADAACSALMLEFVVQPADAAVGQPIPGLPDVPGLPVVPAVQVTDSGGGPVEDVTVSMDLAGGTEGAAFTDTSTTWVTSDAAGIASFENLRVDTSGVDYQLEASADRADPVPVASEPFDVDDDVATCSGGESCEVSLDGVVASGTAAQGASGRLVLSSSSFGGADCTVPQGVTLSRLPQAVRVAGTSLVGKRISFTIDEQTRKEFPDNGVASYQVCAEPLGQVGQDTIAFTDRYSGDLVTGTGTAEHPATGEVQGWLPDCRSGGGSNAVAAPCVSTRTATGNGSVIVTVDFGSGFRMG